MPVMAEHESESVAVIEIVGHVIVGGSVAGGVLGPEPPYPPPPPIHPGGGAEGLGEGVGVVGETGGGTGAVGENGSGQPFVAVPPTVPAVTQETGRLVQSWARNSAAPKSVF